MARVLTASNARHHTSASDDGAAAWLSASTTIIRRYQTRNTGKDLGLAANATSIAASPQDVWGESYENLRAVKASPPKDINAGSIQLMREYDPNSVFDKFHPIQPIRSKSKAPQQTGSGDNGHLRVRDSL